MAVLAFGMPWDMALLSATQGAVFGFFPIVWIVVMALWFYQVTVLSGRFEDMRTIFDTTAGVLTGQDPNQIGAVVGHQAPS